MIRYVDQITSEEYMNLRKMVGWVQFPLEEAQACIDNAYMVLCVRDDGKAIGVVRLLWDGGYIAFLSDVIVDPSYQGQGIGKKLVAKCIGFVDSMLKEGWRIKIVIVASKGKERFYEKFGFVERPNDSEGAGMNMWREI